MITFATPISETQLLTAYNNNVVVFSGNPAKTPAKADVTIGTDLFTYFPHPDKSFYVNFKEWFASLINIDNFADDLVTDLTTAHVYDWTAKALLELSIVFKITYTDTTFEDVTKSVAVINAIIQEEQFKKMYPLIYLKTDSFVMSPFFQYQKNVCLKMWKGMPLDLTIYTGTDTTIDIENTSNLLSVSYPVEGKVNRVVFCDGSIDTSINDELSLSNGFNRLTINGYDLLVEMDEAICDGVYLKWINEQGGFTYWMLPKGERSRPIKSLGVLNNDFKNVSETISPMVQTGKTSFDTLKLSSGTLTDYQNETFKTILDAVKVYMFTGRPFEMNQDKDWLEIEVNNTSAVVERAKTTNNEYQITIDLPRRNTRTL